VLTIGIGDRHVVASPTSTGGHVLDVVKGNHPARAIFRHTHDLFRRDDDQNSLLVPAPNCDAEHISRERVRLDKLEGASKPHAMDAVELVLPQALELRSHNS
jgi:hypothetical protein